LSKEFADVHNLIASIAQHYRYPPPPKLLVTLQEALTALMRAILDLIASLLSVVPGQTDTQAVSNFIRMLLYAMGLIGALLFIWVLWMRLSELGKQAHLAKGGGTPSLAPLTAQAWQEQALALSQARKWKDACRALLLASIRLLDEKEVVPFVATRTNFEYWYALASKDQLRSEFRRIADTVDFCWFGKYEAGEQDFTNCKMSFEAIKLVLDQQSNDSAAQH